MTCDCMTKIDAGLEKSGVRIETIFTFNRGPGEPMSVYPRIPLEKIDKAKRGKVPSNMIPTHCPFCGVRYRADEPAAT